MARLLIGLPLAGLVTVALFLLMGELVRPGEAPIAGEPRDRVELPTLRTDSEVKPARLQRPQTALTPPPPVRPSPSWVDPPALPGTPPTRVPGPSEGTATVLPRGLVPLATMAPQYPASCQARATEGYAVVRFDVTYEGRVVNAAVTESSHACFERAALEAIRGWRYQPALTKEEGYLARGQTKRFSFRLN